MSPTYLSLVPVLVSRGALDALTRTYRSASFPRRSTYVAGSPLNSLLLRITPRLFVPNCESVRCRVQVSHLSAGRDRRWKPSEQGKARHGFPTPPPRHTPVFMKTLSPETPIRPRDAGYPERYAFNAITVADIDIHRPRLLRHVTAIWTDPPAHRGRAKGEAMTSSSCLPCPVAIRFRSRLGSRMHTVMYMRFPPSPRPSVWPACRGASLSRRLSASGETKDIHSIRHVVLPWPCMGWMSYSIVLIGAFSGQATTGWGSNVS